MLHLIAGDAPLGPEWKDHPLKGEWSAHRECHGGGSEAASGGSRAATIGGDFLLIYRLDETAEKGGTIAFVRAGRTVNCPGSEARHSRESRETSFVDTDL